MGCENMKNIDAKNKYGRTVLMEAASNGRTDIVKSLIKAGADVNATTNYGNTALMEAARGGYTEIIEILKKAGAKE